MIAGIRCPKCKSSAVSAGEFINRHWSSTQPDWKLSCMMCGTALYGEVARTEIRKQQASIEAQREEEGRVAAHLHEVFSAQRQAKAREQLPPPPAEIIVAPEILAPQNDKCAWHKCVQTKRAISKYCSDACRKANAHAREWERRKAANRAARANLSAVRGVSSDRVSA